MAEIVYQVLRKPIEQRLIEAGCVYWDKPRTSFYGESISKDSVHHRHILYYLIHINTNMGHRAIGAMFGVASQGSVHKAIYAIDSQKDVTRSIREAINEIQHIAGRLDATFLTSDITLGYSSGGGNE